MKRIFLDTSAYSLFKRASPNVIEIIRQADVVYLNTIVLGELLAGFDGGKFKAQNRKELFEFLAEPTVTLLPLNQDTAERYSFLYQYLKTQGTPIPTNDLWIAASVMESGTALVTTDSHFQKLPQIQVIN